MMMSEENPGAMILQVIIVVLCVTIVILLYLERSTTSSISQKVNSLECPACPSCPDCPACECNEEGCPDCVCPKPTDCPRCPDVNTSCPSQSNVTADDIVDAIFPGRNKGLTSYGEYYPLDGLGETNVEPAYSPVMNMMPNYVGGDGVPAAISFQDQKLLNDHSSIGLASKKDPPIENNVGVMSQNNDTTPSPETASTPASTTASTPVSTPVSSPTAVIPASTQSAGFMNKLGSIF
jgi:hypothetical protein